MPKATPTRPAGRPRLPKGEAKAAMLRIRATPDELKAFDKAAKAKSQTRSEWVRAMLLEAANG